jgi:hypothetical protein
MSTGPADEDRARTGRVRLAIDALTPLTRQAIESAVSLASQGAVRLDCVFVEPLELFHAASLPLTREFGMAMPAPRRLERLELERALQLQAGRARRLLEQTAGAVRLEFSFEVTRGALLDEAMRRAAPQDLLVVGAAGCELDLPATPRVSGREPQRTLLALVESLPADLATLRALLRAIPGATLAVWAAGEAAGSASEIEAQFDALERELGRPLRRLPRAAGAQPQLLGAALAQTLAELRPQLLTLRRETLAGLAAELAWSMRRRPALLVATPRAVAA